MILSIDVMRLKKSQQYIKLRRLIRLGIVRHKSVKAGTAIRKNKDDKKISNKYEVQKTKKIDRSKNKKTKFHQW
jgi:hypothetical protein